VMPFAGSGNSCATGGPARQEGLRVRLQWDRVCCPEGGGHRSREPLPCPLPRPHRAVAGPEGRALRLADRQRLCGRVAGGAGKGFRKPFLRGFETASPPSLKRVMQVRFRSRGFTRGTRRSPELTPAGGRTGPPLRGGAWRKSVLDSLSIRGLPYALHDAPK
jgi:hypothetical protein